MDRGAYEAIYYHDLDQSAGRTVTSESTAEALAKARAEIKYKEMESQHWDGGYYSDEVRARFAVIENLPREAKENIFKDFFNRAWELVTAIVESPRYDKPNHRLDLADQRLGVIAITHYEDATTEHNEPMRMLDAYSATFEPDEDKTHKHPEGWDDLIGANLDGTINQPAEDIDALLIKLFDIEETLGVAAEALGIKAVQTTIFDQE